MLRRICPSSSVVASPFCCYSAPSNAMMILGVLSCQEQTAFSFTPLSLRGNQAAVVRTSTVNSSKKSSSSSSFSSSSSAAAPKMKLLKNTTTSTSSSPSSSCSKSSTKKQQQNNNNSSKQQDDNAGGDDRPVLNSGQRDCLNYILKHPKKSVFITGGAGTGKSVLLRAIADALPSATTYLTAPTGVAALNIGGITLHQFLRLQPDGQYDLRAMITGQVFGELQRRFWNCNTLIVDEISMVEPSVFQLVDRLAQLTRKSHEPFGGMQLVLCGDFLQLPPVGTSMMQQQDLEQDDDDDVDSSLAGGNDNNRNSSGATPMTELEKSQARFRQQKRYTPPNRCNADTTSKYAFQTAEWKRLNPRYFHLTKVMRQKEPELIALLNSVRFGTQSSEMMSKLLLPPSQCTVEHDVADLHAPVRIFCRNKEVNERNRLCYKTVSRNRKLVDTHYDAAVSTPDIPKRRQVMYYCAMEGNAKQFGKVIPKRLNLCVGSRVMLLKNIDVQGGLVNGSTGVVVGFRDQSAQEENNEVSEKALFENDGADSEINNNNNNNVMKQTSDEAMYDQVSQSFVMKFRDRDADTLAECKDIYPVVRFSGVKEPVVVRPAVWKLKSAGSVASKLMQLPLRHAWAITAHKAQGMSFEKVHVDLSCAFENGQAYVALSRARTIKHLKVTGYNAASVRACPVAADFHSIKKAKK